jgi:mycothiol maleylpyruvate isomerase-like protein
MMTRDQQVDAIRADQRFWRDLAAEVGSARYAEPGPMGDWSFGDLAGHLLGWRNRTIRRLEAWAHGEPQPSDPWPPELDDDGPINEWIREHDAGRSPAELVADYDASYDRLVTALEGLSDAQLSDPDAIPWIDGPLVDVDFTGHLHDEHVPSVRAWLATRG